MPALKKTALSTVYTTLVIKQQEVGEYNDCSVKALSIVMEVPYAEVHAAYAAEGRKPKKGTYHNQTRNVLKKFGFHVVIMYSKTFIKQYPASHQVLKNVTTHHPRRFQKVWGQYADQPMLLFTRGHVSAFKDGIVHDWAANHAKPVQQIWLIKKD